MSRNRRTGLRREPAKGWPLDQLFVGVATVRTIREVLRHESEVFQTPQRAWDLAIYSGVTPQGSVDSCERLNRLGLVEVLPPRRAREAPSFRVDRTYPLLAPLERLFAAEWFVAKGR